MRKKLVLWILCLCSCPVLFAEEEASPRDRLIVETLIRLKRFDVSGNEKWKGAVERVARSIRGEEGYFELIEQFAVKSEASELVRFVDKNPSSGTAAKAVQLLFRLNEESRLKVLLAGVSKKKAERLVTLIGFVKTPAAKKLLDQFKAVSSPTSSPAQAAPAIVATPEDITALARRKGNPVAGKDVYMKYCFACHKAGDIGIDFGPGLSEIGSKLPKSELYVAIVKPNAGISFDYEGWTVYTKKGEVFAGIISEANDSLTIRMVGGISQEIKKPDVLKREKMKLSLMPEGMHLAMSEENLVDLVEFLAGLKKK